MTSISVIGDKAISRFYRRGFNICRNVIPMHFLRPFLSQSVKSGQNEDTPASKSLMAHVSRFLEPLLPQEEKKRFHLRQELTVYKPSDWKGSNYHVGILHIDSPFCHKFVATIPLAKFTKKNGATVILESSHRDGYEYNDLGWMGLPDLHVPRTKITKHNLKSATMNVGDMLLVHSECFHLRPKVAYDTKSKRECIYTSWGTF